VCGSCSSPFSSSSSLTSASFSPSLLFSVTPLPSPTSSTGSCWSSFSLSLSFSSKLSLFSKDFCLSCFPFSRASSSSSSSPPVIISKLEPDDSILTCLSSDSLLDIVNSALPSSSSVNMGTGLSVCSLLSVSSTGGVASFVGVSLGDKASSGTKVLSPREGVVSSPKLELTSLPIVLVAVTSLGGASCINLDCSSVTSLMCPNPNSSLFGGVLTIAIWGVVSIESMLRSRECGRDDLSWD
uniref:Uncharacterized protein n=1 Tax=Amphimedon queenslandica TaxID=400682 RepID=A0A1X7VMZ2_AMPQE